MTAYDVAIVGAGPAGSSTALHLLAARPDARVLLLERRSIPQKPCGGAISRWGLEVLDRIGAGLDALGVPSVVVRTIRVRHRDRVAEHARGAPLGAVVRRDGFDAALAREAVRRGATLVERARVTSISRPVGAAGWRLACDDGASFEARLLVGADGTGSAVRRLVFGDGGTRARLIVLETEAVAGDDVGRGVLEFDLSCVDRGIDGYVWHFATLVDGEPRVSRGIFDWRGRRPGDAIALRRTLEAHLAARGVDPKRVVYKPYSERVFSSTNDPLARDDGALLVGEAAGLVDPITGEGIAQALASGCVAGAACARGVGDRFDARGYRAAIEELRCHRHLRGTSALAPHVYGRRASSWAAALAGCPIAIDAGADWYAGTRVGVARKARVGLALAAAAVASAGRAAIAR